MFAWIIEILIVPFLKTTIIFPSNQIIDECAGSEIFSFMDNFWVISRVISHWSTKKRQPLSAHGVPSHTRSSLSTSKMLEPCFNNQSPIHFTIFATLSNLTWMNFLPILISAKITQAISNRFFYAADTITFG